MAGTTEVWREIKYLQKFQLRRRYAVSSRGRAKSFKDNVEDGKIIEGALVEGYRALKFKAFSGKVNLTILKHKAVAELFCRKPTAKHLYVIHLDHDKLNNSAKNLKWVTWEELTAHWKKSPAVIEASHKAKFTGAARGYGFKLTVGQVRQIKRMLKQEKYTLAEIAKKFRVSDMSIHRIKTRANWKAVRI